MPLELYIWGPAFSLPSIDPHCLAAIAYLKQAVPRDEWVLIACSDTTLSPTREFPALRDGSTTVSGFQNIIEYLQKRSHGQWNLDHHVGDSKDRADITAFSSFIESRGQPLLDLNLYVSSENYASTRSAYSPIVQWPTQYFIPPQRRATAKARTDHLGLSSLDLDTMVEDQRNRRKATDLIPGALRVNRPTVTGLVKQQQSSAQFRLDAMLDGFCGPLNQLLGNKRYMLSDYESSSLDCLALGHLAMALIPKLPQPWLAEVMRGRYPQLRKYVENGVKEIFNGRVLVEDAFPRLISELPPSNHEQDRAALPWRAPIRRGFSSAGATILDRALGAMPFYGNNVVPTQPASGTHSASQGSASPASTLIPSLVAASATLVALAGYLIFSSVNHKPEKHRLSDMGEAGAMLAAIDFGGSESSRGEGVPRPEGRLPGGGGG